LYTNIFVLFTKYILAGFSFNDIATGFEML